jgi:hypothetical protein
VIELAVDRLPVGTLDGLSQELELSKPLISVLRNWPGDDPAYLFIDALDATRGGQSEAVFRSLITQVLEMPEGRWRVIASIRSFDLRMGERFKELFVGSPPDRTYTDPMFSAVRHVHVPHWTTDELNQIEQQVPPIKAAFGRGGSRLRSLASVPFNTRLLADLLSSGADPSRRARLPDDVALLGDHVQQVQTQSNELLARITALVPGLPVPSPLADFPGFVRGPARNGEPQRVFAPDNAERDFLRPFQRKPGEYLLATGDTPHFILASPRLDGCGGHDWPTCHALGENAGTQPIYLPSYDPASFFISGAHHHCAHRMIHGMRTDRCKIRAFEDFLCCQTCTYSPICWPPNVQLPCGAGPLAAHQGLQGV